MTTVDDANDLHQVARALHAFKAEAGHPHADPGAQPHRLRLPVEDTPRAHGEPLGVAAVKAAERFLGNEYPQTVGAA